MTHITDLLDAGPTVSFEFFPPATDAGREQLARCIDELAPAQPSFVSVTYGAGGSTRENTRDLVIGLERDQPFPAMPHLTCMGHTRAALESLIDDYAASGIENILALAGDPPSDGSEPTGEFHYASDLVDLVRARGRFTVAVAAFPEGHPRSPDLATDRRFLAAKLERADVGITQFFFDADDYLRMRDDLDALGCRRPVLPGIMPMLNPDVIRRFATMNGARFPEELASRVSGAAPEDQLSIAVDAAVELSQRLLDAGVPGLHLYCLNRSEASLAILDRLGLVASGAPSRPPEPATE